MYEVSAALHISPSAVSQQLALLEDEAGVQLLERRGRRVRLTPAGERLVVHAERVIAVLEEAKTDLAEIRRVVAGELRVSAFPSAAAVFIPKTINRLERNHPHLTLSFEEREPTESLAALRAWETDVALIDDITVLDSELERNIETIPIFEDELYAMLPNGHRLAKRPSVSIYDLRDEKWAMDTASLGYGQVIVDACKAAGFEPIINGRCKGFEIVSSLIEGGCSVSILPGLRVWHLKGKVCIKKLAPAMRRKISLAFRRRESRHPAIGAFIKSLQQVANEYASSQKS